MHRPPPALPAPLILYDNAMVFIDVISGLNLDMPSYAPTNAEIIPGHLKRFRIDLDEIIAWLRANLHNPAHMMVAQLPDYGENHEIEFEDVLDGEAFRVRWRRLCEPFGADLARAAALYRRG